MMRHIECDAFWLLSHFRCHSLVIHCYRVYGIYNKILMVLLLLLFLCWHWHLNKCFIDIWQLVLLATSCASHANWKFAAFCYSVVYWWDGSIWMPHTTFLLETIFFLSFFPFKYTQYLIRHFVLTFILYSYPCHIQSRF